MLVVSLIASYGVPSSSLPSRLTAIIAIAAVSGYMVSYGADTDMVSDATDAVHEMLSPVPTDNIRNTSSLDTN